MSDRDSVSEGIAYHISQCLDASIADPKAGEPKYAQMVSNCLFYSLGLSLAVPSA